MDALWQHWQLLSWVLFAVVILLAYRPILWLFGVRIIPDDSIGVMTKKFAVVGAKRTLPAGRIMALDGEAGYQADALAPGLHLGLWADHRQLFSQCRTEL